MDNFNSLKTEKFRVKMKPHAIKIYQKIFPGSEIEDLREKGFKVHILDKEFGVDMLLNLESGQWLSIQEKYRTNYFLKFSDFTQEHKNAYGTENESDGEWFHLGAQLYFYGWANKAEDDFEKWFLMDIAKYKILIEESGGIEKAGIFNQNQEHGKSSFYSIHLDVIKSAWVTDYRKYLN